MARRRIRLEKRAVIPGTEPAVDSTVRVPGGAAATPAGPIPDAVDTGPSAEPSAVLAAPEADDGPDRTSSPEGASRRRRLARPSVGAAGSLAGFRTLGIVLAAAVAVTVVASLLQQPTPPPAAGATTVQPIGSSVLLCPEPGAGSDLGVRVTAAIVPGQPGQEGSGEPASGVAGLETLPGKESASAKITVPGGQAQIEAFGTRLPAIRAYGEGTLAPGLVADQWGRDPGGQGRGMASTACAPAASEFWFVGGGAIAGRQTRIVLVNPDQTSAVVDVVVHGPDGLIDAPAGRGLVIKGEDRLVVRLDVLAPGVTATAVQVLARTGRVGASVDDEQQLGLATVGTDWIPPAAAPATKVYVPGIVSGDGARVLSVMAPGGDDAIVNVRIIGTDGTYAPAERSKIEVPSDSVVTIDMSPVLDKQPATLELTSDVPIVAGMREFFGGKNVQDETAYTAGSQPFSGPAAVSGLPVRANTDVRVSIAAPDAAAEVDIVLLPYRGGKEAAEATAPRRVKIGAGKMRYIKLSPPAGIDWYTAIVTPVEGSGPIVVAHRVRESSGNGDLVTGYPWNPLRIQVVVPTAIQDPSVANR